MAKVYDDQVFLEQRRKELEFFINEINSHEIIGKAEETKKFLNDVNFDKQYFDSLLKRFNYPEISEKIKENKGIISKGMEKVSDLYNYFIGNKSQTDNQRDETKKILEKTENLEKNLEKFKTTLDEIKNIYKSYTDEYQEKKFISDNLLFLKDDDEINESDIEKQKFNDLVELRQNYNYEKSKIFLKYFEEKIIDPLNFTILYLNGEQEAMKRYKHFLPIRILGKWEDIEGGGHSVPVGGLVYYISPPHSILDFAKDPFHTLFYIAFMLISCGFFSKTWIEVSGSGVNDVAKNLQDQGYFIQGMRENMIKDRLKRYIPIAAVFGGMCIGGLTIFADFLGAIGSGTGILLAVTIIYSFYEEIMKNDAK